MKKFSLYYGNSPEAKIVVVGESLSAVTRTLVPDADGWAIVTDEKGNEHALLVSGGAPLHVCEHSSRKGGQTMSYA